MQEIWKDIPGYENQYQVSNIGNVRSLDRFIVKANGVKAFYKGNHIVPVEDKGGYLRVSIGVGKARKSHFVHLLVCLSFLGEKPKGLEVCHNDSDKQNNCIHNLRYGTRQNNINDRIDAGGYPIGEESPNAILNKELILEILDLLNQAYSATSIAEYFDIGVSTIYDISKKRKWKHLKEVQDFKPKHLRRSKTFTGYSSPS